MKDTAEALKALSKATALGETHSECPRLLAECAAAEGVEVEAAVAAAKEEPAAGGGEGGGGGGADAAAAAAAAAGGGGGGAAGAQKPDRIAHDFYQSADYATVSGKSSLSTLTEPVLGLLPPFLHFWSRFMLTCLQPHYYILMVLVLFCILIKGDHSVEESKEGGCCCRFYRNLAERNDQAAHRQVYTRL